MKSIRECFSAFAVAEVLDMRGGYHPSWPSCHSNVRKAERLKAHIYMSRGEGLLAGSRAKRSDAIQGSF